MTIKHCTAKRVLNELRESGFTWEAGENEKVWLYEDFGPIKYQSFEVMLQLHPWIAKNKGNQH